MNVLDRLFYDRPTLLVARDLIGKVLVHRTGGALTAGAIVEVEAYIGEDDPACHAAPGPTARNTPLYGPPGFAYVYLNYGIHNLFNVVTEAEGRPAAVLVRASVPLDGMDVMRRRRASDCRPGAPLSDHELCCGPGQRDARDGHLAVRQPRRPVRPRRTCFGRNFTSCALRSAETEYPSGGVDD